ncbi:PQQ-binding-like beta-propeller repeat protein [Halorubrum cibi]|uniref:PQQ-like domain-containing protein n=1 Tax=Halorubrum cibi TaxID=413815 RepID=A0A521AF33_9EURY|nr:PQQ-binding-like beta-propeller repeat protein [Halorubrum cibi]SMO33382.1 PQQ-like domain-containing protein [Halorubrum cibi]
MKRRRLLAAVATGAAASLAGCGYAYGGGDVRDVESAGGSSVFASNWSAHAIAGDRIAFAESGDSPFEGERTAVEVIDRGAEEIGTFRHDGLSVGMAAGPDAERVYLRESTGDIVAVTPAADDEAGEPSGAGDDTDGNASSDDDTATDRVDDPDDWNGGDPEFSRVDAPDWQASIADVLGEPAKGTDPVERRESEPIAADGLGAYVASGPLVIAAREGEVDWTVEVGGDVRGLWCADDEGPDGVVVAAGDALVALAPDGSRRWRRESGAGSTLVVDGDQVLLREGDDLLALDLADGEEAWRTGVGGDGPPPTVTGDRVAAVNRGAVRVLDREAGDPLWRAGLAPGRDRHRSLVVDAARAYFVDRDGEAVAVDATGDAADDSGGGRAWTRDLEVRSSTVVDGWIDGGAVAFAFDTGEFVWLQRYDEDPGLL